MFYQEKANAKGNPMIKEKDIDTVETKEWLEALEALVLAAQIHFGFGNRARFFR